MDRPRDHVLAGPGLALDENGDVRLRGLLDDLPDLGHPGTPPQRDLAPDLGRGIVAVVRRWGRRRGRQPWAGLDLLQDVLQVGRVKALREEVLRAEGRRLRDPWRVVLVGDEDHGGRPAPVLPQPAEEIQPVPPVKPRLEEAADIVVPAQRDGGLLEGGAITAR